MAQIPGPYQLTERDLAIIEGIRQMTLTNPAKDTSEFITTDRNERTDWHKLNSEYYGIDVTDPSQFQDVGYEEEDFDDGYTQ